MPVWLNSIVGVLLVVFFFGFSVFIHEFGHLLAAVWRGLHVEKFSIGFGHRIWCFKRKGIDFIVGWLPFGGYVALPQLEPNDEPITSDGKLLEQPKPIDKIIVAVAGPLFNLMFAFVLGVILWKAGKPVSPPIESVVVTDIPAQSIDYKNGLRNGDTILSINDHKIKSSDHLLKEYVLAESISLEVERNDEVVAIPKFVPEKDPDFENLAIPPFSFDENYMEQKAIVNKVLLKDKRSNFVDYPAMLSGIQEGDQFIKIEGQDVEFQSEVSKAIKDNDGKKVNFTILRDGKELELSMEPIKIVSHEIGLNFRSFPKIYSVRHAMPAFEAGIRRWDNIVSVNKRPVKTFKELDKILKANKGKTLEFEVERNGENLSFPVEVKYEMYMIGVAWQRHIIYPTPMEQFEAVFSETFKTINALISRKVPVGGLSGPVGISKGIFDSWQYLGIIGVISFIFMINISLAIFNLLPLPVLDGGHIFVAAAELISRRKIPAKVLQPVTLIFILFFFSLMIYVTMKDVKRTGKFFESVQKSTSQEVQFRT